MKDKLFGLCKEVMTTRGYSILHEVDTYAVPVWDFPTSSTAKYHLHTDGLGTTYIPSIAEHTYEMLSLAVRIMRMYDISPNTIEADLVCFAIVCHDILKYGRTPAKFTASNHSWQATTLLSKCDAVVGYFAGCTIVWPCGISEDMRVSLLTAVAYHNGRWEKWKGITEEGKRNAMMSPLTQFLCFLDMASSVDGIKCKE